MLILKGVPNVGDVVIFKTAPNKREQIGIVRDINLSGTVSRTFADKVENEEHIDAQVFLILPAMSEEQSETINVDKIVSVISDEETRMKLYPIFKYWRWK